MTQYLYDDNFALIEDIEKDAAKAAIRAIYDKLPENARRIDVITHVLKLCKGELNQLKIEL